MEVPSKNPIKCSLELLIRKGVAKRIYRAVGITQEVSEIKQMMVHASPCASTKSLDERTNVIGSPADDERTEDERDGSQRFACPVFAL